MKKGVVLIGLLAVFVAEIIMLAVFIATDIDFSQDAVEINSVVKSVENDFENLDKHINETSLDYAVITTDGTVLFRTKEGLSEDINSAVKHRDTIMDIYLNGTVHGKVIICNSAEADFLRQKKSVGIVFGILVAVQFLVCVLYSVYIYYSVIRPFGKLKGFAERVAGGNLDIPLEMDRGNVFGAFSESFDIMRSELKKARIAEAEANASKKELVAKLSHDIKTPVASIKAASEVGQALANEEKIKDNYSEIIRKADQITTLVSNLFNATLEEMQELTVTPTEMDAAELKILLKNSDYLHRANLPDVPECLVFADKLRLQQVFDNIFANSYKYANTEISLQIEKANSFLSVAIEDNGGGVGDDELPLIKNKFKRGRNAQGLDGAGLGLYISEYFMTAMGGRLTVENGIHGLKVTVFMRLSGTIN